MAVKYNFCADVNKQQTNGKTHKSYKWTKQKYDELESNTCSAQLPAPPELRAILTIIDRKVMQQCGLTQLKNPNAPLQLRDLDKLTQNNSGQSADVN